MDVIDFPNPVGNKPKTSFLSAITSMILLCSGLSIKSNLNCVRISERMSLDATLFCYVLYINASLPWRTMQVTSILIECPNHDKSPSRSLA